MLGSRFPQCRSTVVHPSRAPHLLASHASALDLGPQTDTPHRNRHLVRIRPKPSSSELPAARSPTPPAPPVAGLDIQRFFRGAANFKALLHRRVRSVPMPFPASVRPILPWALFPTYPHSPVYRSLPATHRSRLPAPAPLMPEGAFVAAPSEESGVARAACLANRSGRTLLGSVVAVGRSL